MKKYTIEIVIHESSDEFWEEIEKSGKTGCDEVLQLVKSALDRIGITPDYEFSDDTIKLTKFEEI